MNFPAVGLHREIISEIITYENAVRFEVLTAVSTKMVVLSSP
jgi:hypothetical protein